MRKLLTLVCTSGLMILMAGPTRLLAQTAPQPQTQAAPSVSAPEDEPWSETEILVIGHPQGPAIWTIKRNGAEVSVLGAMPVMVKRAPWNTRRIERLIGDANVFLSGPEARIGPMALIAVATNKDLGWGQSLDQVLTNDLARRFHTLEARWKLNPKKYQHSRPVWAALQLRADIYDRAGLTVTDPEKVVERIAKAKGVAQRPISSFAAAPVLDRIAHFSRGEQLACFANILSEVEFSTQYAAIATQAWGHADYKTVKRFMVNSASVSCLEGNAGTTHVLDKTVDDTVVSLNAALNHNGKAVVVMPISILVKEGGVLSRLRAQGAEITTPLE